MVAFVSMNGDELRWPWVNVSLLVMAFMVVIRDGLDEKK